MKRLALTAIILLSTVQTVFADAPGFSGHVGGQYFYFPATINRETYYHGSKSYIRNKNWQKMLYENFARYQQNVKNYAYQQAVQPHYQPKPQTDLKPVIINGKEYVLYQGNYIQVNDD